MCGSHYKVTPMDIHRCLCSWQNLRVLRNSENAKNKASVNAFQYVVSAHPYLSRPARQEHRRGLNTAKVQKFLYFPPHKGEKLKIEKSLILINIWEHALSVGRVNTY